ncbi:acyl carrier protein [Granulicella sibirica]|uniref:Putative Acyl carrier protein n=1 Tax=Granulicella sibirica TaxID=2479048 RepID=A0A4Q0SWT9_9BACT|nr:phosphopantetheine-binding protein [Granulicella sibirica]RXH54410.1 putative Acyl carrier protein [Granulicella sibirica]
MQVPQDLEGQLIGLIASSKKMAPETIVASTTFESLAIDSLDKINLSFEVEEAFGIEIPDAAIGTIRTVGDMVEGVRGLILAREG